ncbi:MAG: biotin--[acetyl-CoA-carboxylase] ligase [Clostridiales bacterium]|nr:biotin--[acetyl-CoA-carboxylase] ligase [Clostridiales bacterium]
MKIIKLEEVDSTNEYCKRQDNGEDIIVVAKRQSAGKGTKGRSFVSDDGGLYISIMRHYQNFKAENAFKIMVNSCVAVCKTLENFGIRPQIRWANDVLVGGKKICGTLIENTFSGGNISRSIVGMGININNQIPSYLRHIAGAIAEITGKYTPIEEVFGVLVKNLEKEFSIDNYKSYMGWLGSKVLIKTDDKEVEVEALDITSNGLLKVNWGGNMLEISSAEVSLRLK